MGKQSGATADYRRRDAARGVHETGWLIESKSPSDGAPTWFSAGRNGFNWTRDANEAVRFSRREDADRFAEWATLTIWPDIRVTEHKWINP